MDEPSDSTLTDKTEESHSNLEKTLLSTLDSLTSLFDDELNVEEIGKVVVGLREVQERVWEVYGGE